MSANLRQPSAGIRDAVGTAASHIGQDDDVYLVLCLLSGRVRCSVFAGEASRPTISAQVLSGSLECCSSNLSYGSLFESMKIEFVTNVFLFLSENGLWDFYLGL